MTPLERLKQNANFLAQYLNGMSALNNSGIFDFLKKKAEPQIVGLGKDINVMATQAARSAGYFEALDDLYNFREKYLEERPNLNDTKPDYGGSERAIESGDLTEEELHAARTGSKPNYSAIDIRTATVPEPNSKS